MPRPNVEAERREQILSAACEVIADIGMQSLRLTDVAKRAGVSSGMIHYYFDTKRDLVKAAFELNYERSLQSRRDMLDSAGDDPLSTLRALAISYLPGNEQSTQAWRVWAELWAEGMRDADLQEINARLYGQWRELVHDLIVAGQSAGTVTDGLADEFTDVLIAMIDGMSIQYMMHAPQMSLDVMRSRVLAYIDSLAL